MRRINELLLGLAVRDDVICDTARNCERENCEDRP